MTKIQKRALTLLVGSQLLIMLGIGLIIPVEPYIKDDMGLTATDMGIMAALFAAVQFVASPIIGKISDKFARVPLIAAGLFFFAVSEAVFAFGIGNALWLLNLARALGGLAAALSIPSITALAADMTTNDNRARVIGWLSASFSGGIILGPGIGGVLANINHTLPFVGSAVLGATAFLIFMIFMPKDEDLRVKNIAETTQSQTKTIRNFWTVALVMLLLMIFVASFGLSAFENMFSLYFHDVRGFNLTEIAWFLVINGAVSLFFQVILFEKLVMLVGELMVIRISFMAGFVAILWILFSQSKWEVFIATLIIFVGFDILRPAITTMLSKIDNEQQGFINGLNMSLTSVGNIIGPVLGGVLLDINSFLPYSFVAVILVIASVLTFTVKFKPA
ncbi:MULTISPECIES: MFS transporter [Leuconostoc]|jgi:DHA1 family multidrug resistance protein-like MFS transporter|uniref:Multidrug transport protein n=1 Tax=Leuconostoc citreum (strain KM20) TaxID=349519 RepID=B1MVI7_LEUCK|nr:MULTISPECIES: MFS transporter [Leuconostoc]ACA83241.1 Multidrug transport protein [Leuconostoc citreum KM20]KAF0260808.1 MFS transporter [Leuconostoc citreum]MBA5938276.1 MFS transporter [Leuconostoc citreum]MBE4725429.1 MFS transporter [Leuconostoc citreum]MCP1276494.1 MFS transporter [Leuconostoc citreum]